MTVRSSGFDARPRHFIESITCGQAPACAPCQIWILSLRLSLSAFRDMTVWQHACLTCGIWLVFFLIFETMRMNGAFGLQKQGLTSIQFQVLMSAGWLVIWLPLLFALLAVEFGLVWLLRKLAR